MTPFELPSAGDLQRAQKPLTDLIPKRCLCALVLWAQGDKRQIYTAEFGFAGALIGFLDFLTRAAELPAQLLLKFLLAAKEA